jgi:hypothetical protein
MLSPAAKASARFSEPRFHEQQCELGEIFSGGQKGFSPRESRG